VSAEAPRAGEPDQAGDGNRWIYWAVGVVVLLLLVIGLVAYGGAKEDAEAQQKAEQLGEEFERAGLPVPEDLDRIVRSLGSDGGAVCENPANALGKGLLKNQLVNGASFVGQRPVIVDRQVLLGEALILKTYCPDELPDFQEVVDDLKVDDTIEE